jgi:3'(2'), 5'-bisphosphate nucleotidase
MNKAFKVDLEVHHEAMGTILELAKPLQPKDENLSAIQVVGSCSHINPKTLNFVENLKAVGKDVEIFTKESLLKFCLIAEGLAYAYLRLSPTMKWDTAAGYSVCNVLGISIIST